MAEVSNPIKLDDETVKTIEHALSMDCSVSEVCLLANITRQTYYNWINSFPELKERFDILREKPILKARTKVMEEMDKNVDVAKWYLERKSKEFKPKQDITSGDKPLPLLGGQSNVGNNNSSQEATTTEEKN